jgi:hypothetical protein
MPPPETILLRECAKEEPEDDQAQENHYQISRGLHHILSSPMIPVKS